MIFDQLWRLRFARDREERRYNRLIREAEKKKQHDEREMLIQEAIQQRSLRNDEIYVAECSKLRRKAERLGLPVPPLSDKQAWEEGYAPNTCYLNAAARTSLRQAIRKEQHERWEFATLVVKDWAVPIMGIIATIVSLVLAVKLRH